MKFIRHTPVFIDIDIQKIFDIDSIEDVFELDFVKHYEKSDAFIKFIIDKENIRGDEIAKIRCQFGDHIFLFGKVIK